MKKIQKIINSCLRYIFNLNWDASVSLYYLKAHILPFDYRLKYKACLTVFKCIHNIAPLYLTDLLHPYRPLSSLRSSSENYLLKTTAIDSKLSSRIFCIYAPYIWNDLPNAVRGITVMSTFKSALKTHFFKQYEASLI